MLQVINCRSQSAVVQLVEFMSETEREGEKGVLHITYLDITF